MKILKHCIFPLFALVSVMCSCNGNKENPEPTPTPDPAPKAIVLSPVSVSAPAEGGTYDITVKTPFVPQVEKPDWITVSNGTLANYSVVTTLTVAANTAYEDRSATLTFKATGATSATLTVSQAAATRPDPPAPGYDGLASFFGLGWNMGNQFDGFYNGSWAGEKEGYPDETCWMPEPHAEYKATQATFDGLKAKGFTSVRIPVSWLKMIGPAPEYKIDETWMNRVYEVVGFAHKAGLKVIINTHHDENHGVNNDYQWQDIKKATYNAALNTQIKDEIQKVWSQIANKFKDCGDDWLMMEGFNELNDGKWGGSSDTKQQCKTLNEWNQVFVDAVRATGGNNATRWLGVPTYCASPSFTEELTIPTDAVKKIAVAVHFYDPYDYTLGDDQYSDWGHTGAAGKKASGGDEDHVKTIFGKLNSTYIANGIPVYLGEFGCSMRAKSNTRAWAFYKYYMEYVVKAAKTYNLPCFLWDNGVSGTGKEQHGYVHHGNGNYIGNSKEILDVIYKAWNNDSETYTLDYVYSTAPKF